MPEVYLAPHRRCGHVRGRSRPSVHLAALARGGSLAVPKDQPPTKARLAEVPGGQPCGHLQSDVGKVVSSIAGWRQRDKTYHQELYYLDSLVTGSCRFGAFFSIPLLS